MDTNEIPWDVLDVIEGLLKICYQAMPSSFWQSDSRIDAARKLLGDSFPSNDRLEE
jgi:hypothetical protein